MLSVFDDAASDDIVDNTGCRANDTGSLDGLIRVKHVIPRVHSGTVHVCIGPIYD